MNTSPCLPTASLADKLVSNTSFGSSLKDVIKTAARKFEVTLFEGVSCLFFECQYKIKKSAVIKAPSTIPNIIKYDKTAIGPGAETNIVMIRATVKGNENRAAF